MSILIRGMKMPKDCPYCPLAHWNLKNEFTGCEIVKKYFSTEEMYADGKPDFCPLIPIPPHGRLIDADALRLLYDFSGYKPTGDMTEEEFDRLMYRLPVIRAIIDEAPTIIEAEEDE